MDLDISKISGVKIVQSSSGSYAELTPEVDCNFQGLSFPSRSNLSLTLTNTSSSPARIGGTFSHGDKRFYSWQTRFAEMETRELSLSVPKGPLWNLFLMVEAPFKISNLKAKEHLHSENCEIIEGFGGPALSFFSEKGSIEKGGVLKASGLSNIYLPEACQEIKLSLAGEKLIFSQGRIKYSLSGGFDFRLPKSQIDNVLIIGSAKEYILSVKTYLPIIEDPLYVAPDASIWNLKNEMAP